MAVFKEDQQTQASLPSVATIPDSHRRTVTEAAIPPFLKPLFWDADFPALDMERNRDYVIERILEYGDLKEIWWMRETYQADDIVRVLRKSRGLSPRSATFWALIYDVPREEIVCLNKPSGLIPWPG